ncbi:hypothetical protein [Bathymodiolus japonicus methanotrophic gill symbiont]|uniref:hypothetical protein n=1 Tax=Bathymodiolus japonicus methanotrophic gill symbiont TaxID=113269 RepID=UPI001C8EC389|nr:hypothetical protein [Bathymodiolus japonicus methanotrophic gill symbiont]
MRSRCGRRAFRASPIRCVGERIMATGVPEFREVAWRACILIKRLSIIAKAKKSIMKDGHSDSLIPDPRNKSAVFHIFDSYAENHGNVA